MTAASPAERIRTLRAETIAAVEQRRALAAGARRALIVALRDRLICRPGCEDALAAWGLEPPPQRWTVCADAQLSYTREHTDQDEAREQARFGVPDELRLLDPPMRSTRDRSSMSHPLRVKTISRSRGGTASPCRSRSGRGSR